MKKIILFLFLLTGFISLHSQDSIYLVNNTIVAAKITYINTDDIEYKKSNNFEGPTYREKKSNILRVRYSNGDVEFYEETEYFGSGVEGANGKRSLAIEHGEKATIVLITERLIPCEIMDISDLCVVYKEKSESENAFVLMKSSIDKIWKKDSSYSTFSKDGKEFKHPKPQPIPVAVKEEPPVKVEEPPVKKVEPANTTTTNNNTTNTGTSSTTETKKKEEPATKPSSSSDKKEAKGNCQMITAEGDFIDGKNVQVNYTKKTVTYIDQFNKIITHTFKEISVIKCPPNFTSENLLEQ